MEDQRAAVMDQVLRWQADVLALQECGGDLPYGELQAEYMFVGAAEASHGCAEHVAAVSVPALHDDVPDTVYPELHVG